MGAQQINCNLHCRNHFITRSTHSNRSQTITCFESLNVFNLPGWLGRPFHYPGPLTFLPVRVICSSGYRWKASLHHPISDPLSGFIFLENSPSRYNGFLPMQLCNFVMDRVLYVICVMLLANHLPKSLLLICNSADWLNLILLSLHLLPRVSVFWKATTVATSLPCFFVPMKKGTH